MGPPGARGLRLGPGSEGGPESGRALPACGPAPRPRARCSRTRSARRAIGQDPPPRWPGRGRAAPQSAGAGVAREYGERIVGHRIDPPAVGRDCDRRDERLQGSRRETTEEAPKLGAPAPTRQLVQCAGSAAPREGHHRPRGSTSPVKPVLVEGQVDVAPVGAHGQVLDSAMSDAGRQRRGPRRPTANANGCWVSADSSWRQPSCPDLCASQRPSRQPACASRAQMPRGRASRLRAREISAGSVLFSSAPIRSPSRTDSR
jgi:hypothetical protein